MNIKHYSLAGGVTLSLLIFSSCFDNDYDLSDIDTTVRVQTKELTVPIKLADITLKQVLDLDEDSEIVETTDAEGNTVYAIKKTGDFQSDPIKVSEFTTSTQDIEPTTSTLELTTLSDMEGTLPDDLLGEKDLTAYYDIKSDPTSFDTEATDIDEALKSIDWIGVETSFSVTIKITGEGLTPDLLDNILFKGVRIKFPEGLEAIPEQGFFESNNPEILNLTKETLKPDAKGNVSIKVNVTGIDASQKNITFDPNARTFTYKDHIQVLDGRVAIYKISNNLPPTISFTTTPSLEDIKVTMFTGEIEYKVDKFKIDPVDLNNLPDILSQSGTKIWLENPQIYLKANNPVWNYNAYFTTGFQLTSFRDGKDVTYGTTITTKKADGNQSKDNYFVLSPDLPPTPDADLAEEYPNPTHISFNGLQNMLAGDKETDGGNSNALDGIPTTIEINALDPMLPTQPVTRFLLGRQLDAIDGTYAFYAPLQLSDNSRIAYEETIDGWSDDDLDDVTINKIELTFNASTDIPFEATLNIYPIDKNGNTIDAKTNTIELPAMAQNEPIKALMEGNITHFDGIRIKAAIKVDNKGEQTTLAPAMTIRMDNSKAVVTGYYESEL